MLRKKKRSRRPRLKSRFLGLTKKRGLIENGVKLAPWALYVEKLGGDVWLSIPLFYRIFILSLNARMELGESWKPAQNGRLANPTPSPTSACLALTSLDFSFACVNRKALNSVTSDKNMGFS